MSSCSPTSLDRSPGAHGTEFTSKAVQDWAEERDINWHCIEPGKPTQDSYIESGSGKLRAECLTPDYWKDLTLVRKETSEYRRYYNEERPHSALCYRLPAEYARRLLTGESLGGNAKRNPSCGLAQSGLSNRRVERLGQIKPVRAASIRPPLFRSTVSWVEK